MNFSVNLASAFALVLLTLAVTVFADRLRERFHHFDLIQTASVVATLVLAPVNVVYAITGGIGVYNGVVLAASLMALGILAVMLVHLRKRDLAPPPVEPHPFHRPRLHPLRVLAVGADEASFDEGTLAAFAEAGHEVYALVVGDSMHSNVPWARRTITLRLPVDRLAELRPEISAATADHILALDPDLVLLPRPDHELAAEAAVGSAARHGVEGRPVLFFGDHPGRGLTLTTPWPVDDSAFRRDDSEPTEVIDTGRITMPSFATRRA